MESGHVSSDDSTDESSELSTAQKTTGGKRPTRERKSYSSAAEMLAFMNSYSEKRAKAEEEKLKLLKEMQHEKKVFVPVSGNHEEQVMFFISKEKLNFQIWIVVRVLL